MKKNKSFLSIYSNAPDLLLDKIAEVNAMLEKSKLTNGETGSYKFFLKVVKVMTLSYKYMADIRWIFQRNQQLEAENAFLRRWSAELQERLNHFEVIDQEISQGTLDETLSIITSFIASKKAINPKEE